VWFLLRGSKLNPNEDYFAFTKPTSLVRILTSQGVTVNGAMQYDSEMVTELVYQGLVPKNFDAEFFRKEQFNVREQFVACRRTVVTLLALKQRRVQQMGNLDRFLIKELAFCIWITRYNWPRKEKSILARMYEYVYSFINN
jgi:hypothetical protein